MRRIYLLAAATLILGALVFAYSQSPPQSPQSRQTITTATAQRFTIERQISTQQRINRYFHGDVMPKLKTCWNRVQGRGAIEIEHVYTKDGRGNWIADKLTVGTSTLPREQVAVALQCMQDSVRGSSFPADGGDGKGNRYLVNWTWPVPFPANATQLTSAMFNRKPKGGGGSGCDGHGAPAKCYTCVGSKCTKVCVGKKACHVVYDSGGMHCQTFDEDCASGGPFGVTGGGLVIY